MQLFDLLSLFYVFLGARAVWTLVKNWRSFTDDALTAFDRALTSQIAFFVFIPVGVFLHELGHAAATYQVGGTIDWLGGGFHYALFYGYVIPLGRFSPLEDWWIALAGNLVSVVFGFFPLILLRFTNKTWIQYTILTFARIQLGWSLVGYPLLTLAGFEGDWATIYSTRTLFVGAPLFVTHIALVAALWITDRSVRLRRWEVSLYADAGPRLKALDAEIAARPGSIDPVIERGNFYASQNQIDLALADYESALKTDPLNPRALYNIGQLRLVQKRYTNAEKTFRTALARSDSDPQLAARVHYGLGLCMYHRGDAAQAASQFDQAIARAPGIPEFYFWRGTAHRAAHDEVNAQNDFARAAELAAATNPGLAAQARELTHK